MATAPITIEVDAAAAEAYRAASAERRRKLDLLLNLRLQDALCDAGSLQEVMREASRQARANGLTPEILQGILDER